MTDRHEWRVFIDGGDVAGITLVGASIQYGRRTVDEQPTPNSATLTILTPDASYRIADRFPDFGPGDFAARSGFSQEWEPTYYGPSSRLAIGAAVVVEAIFPGGFVQEWEPTYDSGSQLRRFTGRITSLEYAYGTVRITAVDKLEEIARIACDSTRPAETDVARARHFAQLAGIELVVDGSSTVNLLPIEKGSSSNALAELYAAAAQGSAIVYADREGVVHYRTRTAPVNPTTELPGGAVILDSLQMRAELGEITNSVVVEYGLEEGDPKARPTVTSSSPDSIKRYGTFSKKASTQLADKAAAQELADRYIANEAFPLYAMPDVTVTLIKDDPAVVDAIADLDLDDAVLVKPLPIGAPADSYTARVLGYQEELAFPDWLVTYNLAPSDYLEERLTA